MKKHICMALLSALVIGLLAGCGKPAQPGQGRIDAETSEYTAPSAPTQEQTELEKALSQENGVDDSYSFCRENPEQDGYRFLGEYMAGEVFPNYVARWTEGGEYVKSSISFQSHPEGGYTLLGWVLFRGTPKAETGWQSVDGKDLYCRFFSGETRDKKNYIITKSQAGVPLDALNAKTCCGSPYVIYGLNKEPRTFSLKIQKAELYIRSLKKSFVLEDPESLRKLSEGLAPAWLGGSPVSHRGQGFNPMVITLEDGRQFLIETMDDGFPHTDAWGEKTMKLDFWRLFGVPAQAAGFEEDAQGNTVFTCEGISEVYHPDGRILRRMEDKEMEDGQIHTVVTEYTYRPDNQLEASVVYDGGKAVSRDAYEYDDRGRLIKESTYSEGVLGWYFTYEYDDQDRVTAEIWHAADGSLGHKTSNNYYWYDEAGNQYDYGMLDDGTVSGGMAPPAPVRK